MQEMRPSHEPLSKTIRISSAATLLGLFPHYASFYVAATPLLTDQIAEWIMARTPSRYAVDVLDALGRWAKPWADTGGLAALGLCIFLARASARAASPKWRPAVTIAVGILLACGLAWKCGYSSIIGSVAFWAPALAIAAFFPDQPKAAPIDLERRSVLVQVARAGLPLVMTGGVAAIAAESFLRDELVAKRANNPQPLFSFNPQLDRQAFGNGLVRNEITPVAEFYGMSKNTVDPVVDVPTWRLNVTFEGKTLRQFRYGDLLGMQKQLRYVTLRCISNTLKSDLMGTAQWAGVTLAQLIDRRDVPANVIAVAFIGVEGHDDSLKVDYAFSEECLLALGMNGKTLSRTHGFPVRLLAPRYFGCRNVKWLREIRFVTKPYYGTWQRLGYTNDPVIQIASHVDRMRRDGRAVEVGGVSFAGSRGIKAVRVRASGGPWQEARLEPALSPYTWTRWVAKVDAGTGVAIEANAQDCCGVWQALTPGDPFPNGPSGPTIVIARV